MINFFDFYFYKETNSTNDILKEKRKYSKDRNLAVFSEYQKLGRGRSGNIWRSEKGDLTCSFLINKKISISNLGRINLIISNILIMVLNKLSNKTEFKFKWPNDIFIKSRKVSGILIENYLYKKNIESFIVGIGINCVSSPTIKKKPSISLRDLGLNSCPLNLFFQISNEITNYFLRYEKINYSILSKRLTKNFYKKKSKIFIKSNTKEIGGLFKEINSNGELIIKSDDQTIHKFSYGEILT
jgi:BirA family biotin operon repressor/biotin-[acetyl-CoA-carboxylase] ligase